MPCQYSPDGKVMKAELKQRSLTAPTEVAR